MNDLAAAIKPSRTTFVAGVYLVQYLVVSILQFTGGTSLGGNTVSFVSIERDIVPSHSPLMLWSRVFLQCANVNVDKSTTNPQQSQEAVFADSCLKLLHPPSD